MPDNAVIINFLLIYFPETWNGIHFSIAHCTVIKYYPQTLINESLSIIRETKDVLFLEFKITYQTIPYVN